MEESIYYKLGERLNQFQVKMLLIEPFLDILREFYTEEQAEVGVNFPSGTHTAAELALQMKRDEGELTNILEGMADNGLVFVTHNEKGESRYALTQFVPGVVEFQLMRGLDNPRERRIARMLEDFKEGEMGELTKALFQDEEMCKQMIPVSPARTITVEAELPNNTQIYPFEKLSDLIEQEESFAAAKCYCRHHAHLVDNPCKIEGLPEYSCLMIGKVADYIVEREFGKKITKAEAWEILKTAEEAGLIHNVSNYRDKLVFICNCCSCCCGFLTIVKEFNNKQMVAPSNFRVKYAKEDCVGCGDCVERCQMEAISMGEDVISIKFEDCIGCGNCVSTCPSGALSMERRAELEPPMSSGQDSFMGV